jgi:hypothetical protein
MIHQREVILKKVIESSKIKSYVDFVKENQAPGLQSSLIPFTSFNVAQGTTPGNFSTGVQKIDKTIIEMYLIKKLSLWQKVVML